MTINLSDNSPRVNYTVSQGATQSAFAVPFEFFDDDDLNVYVDGTLKTLTTHYTTADDSGNSQAHTSGTTGFIHFTSGNHVTGATGGSSVRVTDFPLSGPFNVSTLNTELDRIIAIAADIDDASNRALILSDFDTTASLTLPDITTRANKQLGFDGSGNLVAEEGKVSSVSTSVSAVSAGGTPTASATFTASSGALALAFGLVTGNTGATGATGPTGTHSGLAMTFSNSTSDADPGAGKVAFNNGSVGSVTEMYFDDVDDNGATISAFVQSWDDVTNATARGILFITKESTPSTYALFKVTGAVTNASGYSKVPVTFVTSSGSFSNTDGITVDFNYSGADGAGNLTNVVDDTSPELGGDLDVLARDIVSSSNRDIDLAPHGTGKVVVKGNDNPGTIVLNCESNSHGQTLKSQPHSASVTNTMLLPAGASSTLVSLVSTDTLSNKTLAGVTVSSRAVGHVVTDNDGNFNLSAGNDFKCTTAGGLTLTFTNAAAGQSGNIMFVNGGNHTIAAHADVAISADSLTAISATGTYHLAYYCSAASGSNTILVSASAALT